MAKDLIYLARKYCYEKGIKIYPIPHGRLYYKIVIATATKYNWNNIPKDKKKDYELVSGVVYKLKIGEILYKKNPSATEVKYWEKLDELHLSIYNKNI